jgi:hypothetical protein
MISSDEQGPVQGLATDVIVGRYARLAHQIIERRRARRALLPQGMQVDVAWELLLHLLAYRFDPAQTTVEALANAHELSPSVALRWLTLLQADALVECRAEGWALTGDFLDRLIRHFREHYPDTA